MRRGGEARAGAAAATTANLRPSSDRVCTKEADDMMFSARSTEGAVQGGDVPSLAVGAAPPATAVPPPSDVEATSGGRT